MEKKRRARINSSLNDLRSILLEARKLDEFQVARMEKAEILEATIQHLKDHRIRRAQATLDQRLAGYNACAKELQRRLSTTIDMDDALRMRLFSHIYGRCATSVQSNKTTNFEVPGAISDRTAIPDIAKSSPRVPPSVPLIPHGIPVDVLSVPPAAKVSGADWVVHAQVVSEAQPEVDIWRPW